MPYPSPGAVMSKGRPPSYPVSQNCPQCGSAAFKRVKPDAELAFASDRVCKECGTRYTPPTPAWARMVFVGLGLVFLVVGVALGIVFLTDEPQRLKGGLLLLIGGPACCASLVYRAFTLK